MKKSQRCMPRGSMEDIVTPGGKDGDIAFAPLAAARRPATLGTSAIVG